MATPLTPTDIGGLLQRAYAGDPNVQALFSKFPLWEMISKVGNSGGESFNMTCLYQAAVRVGSDPASIYGLIQRAPAAQFQLTPKRQYGYSSIDGMAMVQAGTGMEKKALASFINVCHAENVAVTKTMAKLHALYLTRGGTGTLGNIDPTTTIGTAILILSRASDQYNFEEGQTLQLSATDGGVARAGSLIINSVPGNGTLVMSGNITAGVAAAAVNDFIVLIGEGQTQTFPGLKSWCPFSSAKGTFGGVDRTVAPRKLAGFYVDASVEGLTIDAAISAGLNRFKANEGEASHGYLNPLDFEALAQTGATNVVVDQGGEREFGFKALSVVSDGSKVRMYEDSTVVQGECWLLKLDQLEMRFVGKAEIAIDDRDGLTLRKVGTNGADSWEMTFSTYPYGLCIKNGMAPGRVICGVKLY